MVDSQRPRARRRANAELAQILPAWLPPPVATSARIAIAKAHEDKGSDQIERVQRLASDPRMKNVWKEVLKRKRLKYESTGAFVHPATPSENWSPQARARRRQSRLLRDRRHTSEANKLEAWARLSEFTDVSMYLSECDRGGAFSRQDRALAFFFFQALRSAQQTIRPVSETEAKAKRRHYLKMANQIRDDVTRLGLTATELLDAAFAYEQLADNAAPPSGDPLLVKRKRRGDEGQNGFVMALAVTATAIFGSSLYGIVATVTNVIFDCEHWTGQRVRKVVAHTLPLIPGSGTR
jgi:hypothetical protein